MMKYMTVKTARRAVVAAALFAATTSFAGVKYWDNPDFKSYDVGDYVQDGLVLHYDGIRNIGLGQPHSSDTLYWNNLGPNSPTKNLEWSSRGTASLSASRRISTHGSWTGNGFHFDGGACWIKWNDSNPVTVPANYTMQFTMTANASDQTGDGQTGYIFFPHNGSFGWTKGTVAMRSTAHDNGYTAANAVYAVDADRLGNSNIRPYFTNASPKYATVMSDGTALRTFEGTTLPAFGNSGYAAITGTSPLRSMNVIALGGFYDKLGSTYTDGGFQGFTGTLHSYRLYSRALTEEELAWNRVVDEKRFFGTQLPIPSTNAVIRSNIRRASGTEPVGCYAVDASGYTFTAPATTNIAGHTYTLLSAKRETWDATEGAWGTAETVAVGATGASVAVANTDLVRISWKWRETSGIYSAADLTIDDIVTDGLVLHYDGILNDGFGNAHAADTRSWQNLAEDYADWPLVRVEYIEDKDKEGSYNAIHNKYYDYSKLGGAWTENGFTLNGTSCLMKWNDTERKFVWTPEHTWQFTMETSLEDLYGDNSYGQTAYLFMPHSDWGWERGSIAMRLTANGAITPANAIYSVDNGRFGSNATRPYFTNSAPRFVNAVGDTSGESVFEGVILPSQAPGCRSGALTSPRTNNWIAIGGQYNPTTGHALSNFQAFRGTLHSIRYYDRALEEWELKRNRNVDSARYFHELGVTNVLVTTRYADVEGGTEVLTEVAGAYKVEGSWTFTATSVKDSSGNLKNVAGYYTEDLVNGTWSNKTWHEGASYTYEEGAAAATVRLTWSGPRPGMIFILR